MTARPSPYPGTLRRISYKELRLITPTDAVFAVPTHPATPPSGVLKQLDGFFDLQAPGSYVIATNSVYDVDLFVDSGATAIVNLHRVNDIRRLNKFFETVHDKLVDGGYFVICVETLAYWKRRVKLRFPTPIAQIYMALAFVLKRVLPKLRATRALYFSITKGRNRLLSRAETLGRIHCCGFEVVDIKRIDHLMFIVARKAKAPTFDLSPSYGPIFRMRRVGQHGRPIHVYKLRTMFPYAEYLQSYVYEQNSLREGGKLANDFRVTPWGRFFRRWWIDELPMLINWAKGELKLVGVRPLSVHYESLYPPALREHRRCVKPGLIPPFYADLPRTFEEILDSESRYLYAYERSPLITDVRYFFKALWNIVFRGARSG